MPDQDELDNWRDFLSARGFRSNLETFALDLIEAYESLRDGDEADDEFGELVAMAGELERQRDEAYAELARIKTHMRAVLGGAA